MNEFGILGPLLMFGFFVGVVLLVLWLIRASHYHSGKIGQTPSMGGPSKALEILQERFARGELTKEQYAEMKKTLEG